MVKATTASAVLLLLFTQPSFAQDPIPQETPPPLTSKAAVGDQSMKIVYGSATWNADSTKLDSAFLFMKDKRTGKTVKIRLEETEPDSSIFSGSFAVNLGSGGGAVDPEIYVPPKNLRDDAAGTKKFSEMMAKGEIKGKPVVLRPNEGGGRLVDVYDTPDQVAKAQVAYTLQDSAKEEKADLNKPAVKPQDLETAENAKRLAWERQMAIITAKRESDRVRQEQIERQKTLELEKQAKALSTKQKQINKAAALKLATEALTHFTNGEFTDSAAKYQNAIELDPEEKSYLLSYGIALYRADKLPEAIVALKVAPATAANAAERSYYMGLVYYRLMELDSALAMMREVSNDQTSSLIASATFYEGVILFIKERYDESKAPFEKVIDISEDPGLDEQAENYLDKLAALIRQQEAMKKKWFINGLTGLIYDSNVLLASDTETAQGTATQEGDIRVLASGDVERRFVYTKEKEFGVKAFAYYLRSSKDEVSTADPLIANLSTPFVYKGMALGKGYKFAIKPLYEVVMMDINDDGTRENILNSAAIQADNTFVMKADWFAAYTVELRSDDSLLESSTGDENGDAIKVSLKTTQTFLLDTSAKRIFMANGGYVMNQAQGDNKFYNRYEIGATFIQPTDWGASLNLGLSYYFLDYKKHDDSRKDHNMTFSTGVTKPIKDWVSWNVTGSYISNKSSVTASDYSKYTIMATAVFNYAK